MLSSQTAASPAGRQNRNILLTAFLTGFFIIFLYYLNNLPPLGDDYGFMVSGTPSELFHQMWQRYHTWNPRFGECLAFPIGYGGTIKLFTILNPPVICGICYFLSRSILQQPIRASSRNIVLYAFSMMLFFSSAGIGYGSFIWMAGSLNWTWPLLALTSLSFLLGKACYLPKTQRPWYLVPAVCLSSLISGWYAETVSPIVFLVLGIITWKIRRTEAADCFKLSLLFTGAGIGILIYGLLTSTRVSDAFLWLPGLTQWLDFGTIYNMVSVFWPSLLMSFAIFLVCLFRRKFMPSRVFGKIKKAFFLFTALFIISVVPLGFAIYCGMPRALMFPSILTLALELYAISQIWLYLNKTGKIVVWSVCSALFIFNTALIHESGRQFKTQYAAFEQKLLQAKEENASSPITIEAPCVKIKKQDIHIPNLFLLRAVIIEEYFTQDPENWKNYIIAQYFNLPSIQNSVPD